VPKLSVCDSDLPSVAYGTLTPPVDAVLDHDESRDGLCGADRFYIDFTSATQGPPSNSAWGGCPSRGALNPRCVAGDDDDSSQDLCVPTVPAGAAKFYRGWVVGCFCVKVWRGRGRGRKTVLLGGFTVVVVVVVVVVAVVVVGGGVLFVLMLVCRCRWHEHSPRHTDMAGGGGRGEAWGRGGWREGKPFPSVAVGDRVCSWRPLFMPWRCSHQGSCWPSLALVAECGAPHAVR
jgi:hypothetical protein